VAANAICPRNGFGTDSRPAPKTPDVTAKTNVFHDVQWIYGVFYCPRGLRTGLLTTNSSTLESTGSATRSGPIIFSMCSAGSSKTLKIQRLVHDLNVYMTHRFRRLSNSVPGPWDPSPRNSNESVGGLHLAMVFLPKFLALSSDDRRTPFPLHTTNSYH
jgi:hypothetical protein